MTTTEIPAAYIAETPIESAVKHALKGQRDEFTKALNLCDRVETILMRLTPGIVRSCHIVNGKAMFFNLTRDDTLELIRMVGAGQWLKAVNANHADKLDYITTIDGVHFQIYAAPPPTSCRIVEEEIEVPAHKEIKRTLVCK